MTTLLLCSGCARHVRSDDAACPFCGAELTSRVPSRGRRPRLARAAVFAGAALLGTACGGGAEGTDGTDEAVYDSDGTEGEEVVEDVYEDDTANDTVDAEDNFQPMPYGAPPRRERIV